MSVPVVVVVHGNQGPNSEATIIWDNMFSDPVIFYFFLYIYILCIRYFSCFVCVCVSFKLEEIFALVSRTVRCP